MTEAEPGLSKGRLQTRGHLVDVRISYSATSYSINYANSSNLMAKDGTIHKT